MGVCERLVQRRHAMETAATQRSNHNATMTLNKLAQSRQLMFPHATCLLMTQFQCKLV